MDISTSKDKGLRVSEEKGQAYKKLGEFPAFSLKNDLFMIHGWGDEANVCWTCPYTEAGKKRTAGWKYTFSEWAEEKIINHTQRVHYIKLVKDETAVQVSYDRFENAKVELVVKDYYDETYFYTNFFQFAELLKDKIKENRETDKIDLLCHSMGGLDAVTAIALDSQNDSTRFIKKPYLKGVDKLITVATPHRGSPKAKLANGSIAKLILHNSPYVCLQGENMSPQSSYPFIRLINELPTRNKLLERISQLHIFGGTSDIVVPRPYYLFNDSGISSKNIFTYEQLEMAAHSQIRGITQDPRLILKVFEILSKKIYQNDQTINQNRRL